MLIAAQCLVPSLQRTDVAWKEPTTHVCPQNLVLNAAMAIDNAILRLQLGNECVTESALERLAPEPLLCTAGVGLALFTVGFCTGTASSLFTAVVLRAHRFLVLDCWLLHRRHSWLWKNHRCLLGQHLATERRGKARPGKGPLPGPLLGASASGPALRGWPSAMRAAARMPLPEETSWLCKVSA